MKIRGKNVLTLVLAFTMLLSSLCVSAIAAQISDGTNGKIIYMSTKATDKKEGSEVYSVESGKTFVVEVNFANNPTVLNDSIQAGGWLLKYDNNKMTVTNVLNGLVSGTYNKDFASNIVFLSFASTDGIYKLNEETYENEVQANGTIAYVVFKAKEALTAEDLESFTFLAKSGETTAKITDGATKDFTVIQTPALAVTVAENAKFYDTTTAAELKAALTVESIAKDGTKTPVTDFSIDVTTLDVGENTVTVTAGDLSETVTINAEEDKVKNIAVTTQPKLAYTTGEMLDLSNMVITATCKSGKTKPVTDYTASIADGTALTVTNHNGKTITITADEKTAETGALTVAKITVVAPTAEGTYTYTGSEQSFRLKDSEDKDYYKVFVQVNGQYELATADNLKGTATGTYTAEARLNDLAEMQWSDYTTAPKTLTWEIKADTTALTVELPADGIYTYNGTEQEPNVTVKSGEKTLTVNTDYAIAYENNVNAGTATVKVTGVGNYAGATGTASFTISPVTLTAADLEFFGPTEKTYDGSVSAPAGLKVQVKSTSLKKNDDVVNVTGTLAYDNAAVSDSRTIIFTANSITEGNYVLASDVTLTTNGKITAKSVSETRETVAQSIVKGVGTFTEPTFDGITGTLSYSYNDIGYSYADLVAVLKNLEKDTTGTISYTYTASGNYTGTITGSISFTVVDILFTVNGEPATVENALTVKAAPVYGDAWNEIVKVSGEIVASVGSQTGTGTYTLQQIGRPNAGEQSYTVVFNGTVGDTTYSAAPVLTGTVTVAPKTLTVNGLAVKTKSYDGTNEAELDCTNVVLVGKLTDDNVNFADSVAGVTAAFADANAGIDKAVSLSGNFALTGAASSNYTLTQPTGLTGTITAKEIEIDTATATGRDYEKGNKNVTVTVTFKDVVGDDTVGYTATGEMDDDNAGKNKDVKVTVTSISNSNYTLKPNETTAKVDIEKINWDGTTLIQTSGKYGSTVEVDVSFLPEAYSRDYESSGKLIESVTTGAQKYVLKLNNDVNNVDKVAVYVSEFFWMTNYNDFTLTIEITILDKDTQTLTADDVSVVYGDTFTPVVNARTNVTFQLKEGETLLKQNADGSLTAIGSGTTTVTAIAAETGDYKSASKEIAVTIAKRQVTVTADDVSIDVGEKLPELTYTVSGLVFGDSWITVPTLTTDPATVETNKAGEYAIVFSERGTIKDDYSITYVEGKLSIAAHNTVTPVSGKTVTVDAAANGRVSISPSKASTGKIVTVTVTPDQGYELDELLVTDRKGNALTVTDLGNGRYSFVMPASSVTVSATFKQVKQSSYYADVLPGIWYYDAVQYVTEQGLMGGTGKGFEPDLTTSRAMIWTILARMDGVDTTAANGSWYIVAQSWAMANGVSDGTDPDGLITREQLAAMLYRYAVSKGIDVSVGEDTNILSYTDATSVSEWAVSAMQWACGAGIINGVDGSLLSQGNATRAQTATMLMRYLELVK